MKIKIIFPTVILLFLGLSSFKVIQPKLKFNNKISCMQQEEFVRFNESPSSNEHIIYTHKLINTEYKRVNVDSFISTLRELDTTRDVRGVISKYK